MKSLLSFVLLLVISGAALAQAAVGPDFGVAWDANPPAEKVVSYTLAYGSASGVYTQTFPGLLATTYSFKGLAAGDYYIAVLAVNAAGQKSPWSKELVVTVSTAPSAPGAPHVSSGGLVNVGTRASVGSGEQVMIAGFILTAPETVAVRALGPSLGVAGIAGALPSAQVELHDSAGAIVASNNGWRTGPDVKALKDLKLAPSSPKESALIASLAAGNYTAVVAGPKDGVGMVEVYQLP